MDKEMCPGLVKSSLKTLVAKELKTCLEAFRDDEEKGACHQHGLDQPRIHADGPGWRYYVWSPSELK